MLASAAPHARVSRCALSGACHTRITAPQLPPAASHVASRRGLRCGVRRVRPACAQVRDDSGKAVPGPAVAAPVLPAAMVPRWLPAAPALGGAPARSWSPTALAYLGDTVWELYARRYFFAPARLHATYVAKVTACTRAEAQAAAVAALTAASALSDAEQAILKWGRNAQAGRVPERLRAQARVYRDATALEVLVGYLYVSDQARLEQLMTAIGWDAQGSDAPPAPGAPAGAVAEEAAADAESLLSEDEVELDE